MRHVSTAVLLPPCIAAPTFASTLAPLEISSSNRETFPSLAAAKISSLAPHSSVFLPYEPAPPSTSTREGWTQKQQHMEAVVIDRLTKRSIEQGEVKTVQNAKSQSPVRPSSIICIIQLERISRFERRTAEKVRFVLGELQHDRSTSKTCVPRETCAFQHFPIKT